MEKPNCWVSTPKFCSYLLLSSDHSKNANCDAPVLPLPAQSQLPFKWVSEVVAYFKLLSWHLQRRTSYRFEPSASMTKPTIPIDFNVLPVTYCRYSVPYIIFFIKGSRPVSSPTWSIGQCPITERDSANRMTTLAHQFRDHCLTFEQNWPNTCTVSRAVHSVHATYLTPPHSFMITLNHLLMYLSTTVNWHRLLYANTMDGGETSALLFGLLTPVPTEQESGEPHSTHSWKQAAPNTRDFPYFCTREC